MEKEIWKIIDGYNGLYYVSNLGNVKSFNKNKEIILKSNLQKNGYIALNLYKNGKRITYTIHRLVAKAFIENPNNLPQVNHIDGNKLNNNLSNLEWCDNGHNIREAFRLGLNSRKKGIENKRSKKIVNLKTNEVYYSLNEASIKLGMKRNKISYHLNSKNNTLNYLKYENR